jgi:hypothetical protein
VLAFGASKTEASGLRVVRFSSRHGWLLAGSAERSICGSHGIDGLPGPLHPRYGGFRVVPIGGREHADASIDTAAGGQGGADCRFHRGLTGIPLVPKITREQRSGASGDQMI